jgi:hypothetical protein
LSEIEDLKIQLRRMQAMFAAHEHLLLAMFDRAPDQAAVLAAFDKATQATRDLLLLETEFSDEELGDGDTAVDFLRRTLASAMRNSSR